MFLKLLKSVKGQGQGQGLRGFANQIHTQICLNTLFDQRRKVENEWKKNQNEWDDDEHEQRRAFREEEMKKKSEKHEKKEQPKCEITNKKKHYTDCSCKGMCIARKSETHLIYYSGFGMNP